MTRRRILMRPIHVPKLPALLLAAGAILAAGCPPKKPAPPPQPTAAAPEATSTPTIVTAPTAVSSMPVPTPRMDVLPSDITEANRRGYLKDAFYDFDKSDVRADARDMLAADAEWLRKHPSVKITIEGHCDERGTREYNLALGDRRANAAREYLVSLGVDAGRIRTVSYGKERPFATGHDEDSWQKNRRAHFVITAL
jgi:peptidoglycan-associated lipoprotein